MSYALSLLDLLGQLEDEVALPDLLLDVEQP